MRTALLATVLALVGCKTDGASAPTASTEAPAGATPTETGRPHRSGKIDLPPIRTRPTPAPSLDTPSGEKPMLDDDDARRAARRAEREESRAERRAMADADGDGKVSPEEMTAARKQRLADMRERLDTDGDGKLSITELSESRIARRMDDPSKLDVDKDGNISAEELQSSMEQMRERAGVRGNRRGGWGGWGGDSDGRGGRGSGSGTP